MCVVIVRYDFSELSYQSEGQAREGLRRLLAKLENLARCPAVRQTILAAPDDEANARFLARHAPSLPESTSIFLGDVHDMGRRILAVCDHYQLDAFLDLVLTEPGMTCKDIAGMQAAFIENDADIVFFADTPKTLSPKYVRAAFFRRLMQEYGGWPYYGYITMREDDYKVGYYAPSQAVASSQNLHNFSNVLKNFRYFYDLYGGGTVLEVGSGFNPLLPLTFSLAGATRVYSVDVVPLWDFGPGFLQSYLRFLALGQEAGDLIGLELARIPAYLDILDDTSTPLLSRLEALGIHHALCGVEDLRHIPDRSIDFAYSDVVFEHVRNVPAGIRELARVARPGGLGVHRIAPLDHRTEKGITPHAYFAFSPETWEARLDRVYTNRWVMQMFRDEFRRNGLTVEQRDTTRHPIPSEEYAGYDEAFKKYPPEELEVTMATLCTTAPGT